MYRPFGRTGVRVAPLALGTDNFLNPTPSEECEAMLLAALEAGINVVDTSNSYKNGVAEESLGRIMHKHHLRDTVFLASKVHYPTGPGPNDRGNSRQHIMQACEDSLRRLRTDHLDLYQLHRMDDTVPLEETLGALNDLVRLGLVRYPGVSTVPAWRTVQAHGIARQHGFAAFVSEQPPYNLLDRRIENEILPACQELGMAVLPWSPLGMGVLAGRYDSTRPEGSRAALRGGIYAERITERAVQVGQRFVRLAHAAGWDAAQLALCWVKDQPGVTAPILGPRTLQQLQDALPVLGMSLPNDVRQACDALVPPGSAVANFFNSAPWMRMKLEFDA